MSKRSLADELQSVLLARSFDAPRPEGTVGRILAATVGVPDAESPPSADAPPAVATPAVEPRSVGETTAGGRPALDARAAGRVGLGDRRRLRSWPRLIGAAAAVVVGAGVVGLLGLDHSRQPGADLASRGSGPVVALGSATPPADRVRPGQPQVPAQALSTSRTSGELAPPSDLGCGAVPGGRTRTGLVLRFTVGASAEPLTAVESLCVGTDGRRSGSEVSLLGSSVGGRRTLLSASADRHLASMTAGAGGLRLRYTEASAHPAGGAAAGALYELDYSVPAGTPADTGTLVAPACSAGQLGLRVQPADGGSYLIRLVNRGGRCVIEGYPSVVSATGVAASQTLAGPRGGLRGADVPPVVLVPSGGVASARLEAGGSRPAGAPLAPAGCAPAGRTTVSLPSGGAVGTVDLTLGICAVQVHPVVGGSSGSG